MPPRFYASAYGLLIRSVLALPELAGVPAQVDVAVRPKVLARGLRRQRTAGGSVVRALPGGVVLSYDGVGTFRVRHGSEIVIQPEPGVEERLVRSFLLGPALAALLHQRGRLVLHASAVAMNDGAALFLGGSGSGKSTLLAALSARGHKPVADDVAAVDTDAASHPALLPGIPHLKLFPETATFLGSNPARLTRVHAGSDKRVRRLPLDASQSTYPLRRVYVLAAAAGAPVVAPLSGREAVLELVRHTYTAKLLTSMGDSAQHLHQCARVAEHVPVRVLTRRRSLSLLSETARVVEADFALDGS